MNQLPSNKLLDLSGKTAVVTGGAVGIGKGICARLSQAGANVAIVDLNQAEAEKTASELSSAIAVRTDVSAEADVESMVAKVVEKFGQIDILVNNAGIYPNTLVMNMSTEEWERVIHVNLRSVFLCTKKIADQMIKQGNGGKIINITSIDALHPSSVGLAHYDASKHGIWGFTKNVALELAPHKIWVNALAPGGIVTPGVENAQKQMETPKSVDMSKMIEVFMNKIPMRRMGEPDDIGKATLFLASDMASYMTGTQIVVDGGVLLS